METMLNDSERMRMYDCFAKNVRAFVQLLEMKPPEGSPLQHLTVLTGAMLAVAQAGLLLDVSIDGGADDDALQEQHDVTKKEIQALREHLEEYFRPLLKRAVKEHEDYEPYMVILHMLLDDLEETYVDLVRGLRMWDSDHVDGKSEATWFWCFGKGHWHEHLYRAMMGVTLVRFSNSDNGLESEELSL